MLREEVRQVRLAEDLAETDSTRPDNLLDPQSVGVQVSQLAEPLSGAYAYGGGRVRPDPHKQIDPEVS